MRVSRFFAGVLVAIGMAIAVVLPAYAADAGTGASAQGYAADTFIDNGTIVQLTGEKSDRVKIATKNEVQNMFGVTVDRRTLPVAITNDQMENQVFVAVSGTHPVLVSTQGGPIAKGDYLTLSSVNGIAMKAGTEPTTVFGRAGAAFDGKGVTLGTTKLKDVNGNEYQTVALGQIPVTIDIRKNPNDKSTKANLPDFLERIGKAIAEKEVSPIRIYLSIGITIVSLIAAIVVLYAGVRSGVISIGRNPMSKKSIFRAILQTIMTSILILIIGLFAVYLLLRL